MELRGYSFGERNSNNMNTPTIKISCVDCKNDFMGFSIKQKRCADCQKLFRNNGRGGYKYTRTCEDCKVVFKSANGRAKKCSKCYHEGTCEICNAVFKRKSSTKKYCSKKCSSIARSDYYYGGNYSKTLKRDNWKCRKCKSENDLQVHHIDHSGAENVKQFNSNNDMENLITLCIPCHSKIHVMTDEYLVNKYKKEVVTILNKFLEVAS